MFHFNVTINYKIPHVKNINENCTDKLTISKSINLITTL